MHNKIHFDYTPIVIKAHGIEVFEKLVFSQIIKKFPTLYETD
jgi:hypothetical protein